MATSIAAAPINSEPLPPMSMPTSAITPASPTSIPAKRVRVGCSARSKRSARKATTSGTAAIRIAASDEDTRTSPKAISGNGTVISQKAKRASQRSARQPAQRARRHAIGSRIAAAIATRDHATKPGDRSSTATLMNR